MRSSVARDSGKQSHLTDFEAAAGAVGAQVRVTEFAELDLLLTAYSSASPEGVVGYSSELQRWVGNPSETDRPIRPDTWVSRARLGIASTGTVLAAERVAEDRKCALLCTHHALVLPCSRIVATPGDAAEWVRSFITAGFGYVTLITGPSRTSDIEKVLTLGAHGPARLDIILVDGWQPPDD
jgi:L-lactate dehydrogenase complex protein LldG